MRSTLIMLVIFLALLGAPSPVLSQDYISDAAQALQQERVYVAPGTEGTDHTTADRLVSRLKSDDNIVLVMLPASAKDDLGVTTITIAQRLSDALDNQRIIGLAVGNEVVGYAPFLSGGVAADQMRRAEIVSNDPVTALRTFAQNMQDWQRAHPDIEPTPPEPEASSDEEGSGFWWLAGVAGFLVPLVILVSILFTRKSAEQGEDRTKFDAPKRVSELLTKIATMRPKVHDKQLRETITQLCTDTSAYFEKYSTDTERDAKKFEQHLTGILDVLTKYVEVQNHHRYYDDPSGSLRAGKEAVEDFSEFVLSSCRRGSAEQLLDYSVNTRILSAHRYR